MTMKIQLAFFLWILIVVKEISTLDEALKITEPIQIIPYSKHKSLSSDLPKVPAKQCGGSGRMINVTYEICKTALHDLCIVPVGVNGRIQVVFIPSQSSKGVIARFTFSSDGEVKQYQNSLPDINLEAGHEYVLSTVSGVVNELKGRHFIAQTEIFRESDKQMEICGYAHYFAV